MAPTSQSSQSHPASQACPTNFGRRHFTSCRDNTSCVLRSYNFAAPLAGFRMQKLPWYVPRRHIQCEKERQTLKLRGPRTGWVRMDWMRQVLTTPRRSLFNGNLDPTFFACYTINLPQYIKYCENNQYRPAILRVIPTMTL